jgi:AcrR family transcriptional regulator
MVISAPIALHPSQDEDSSKRRQILDGARRVFMDLGFDGASMNEIARSAGVSKGTLYVYFTDKSRLFEAMVEEKILEQGTATYTFDFESSVEATLLGFGRAYIDVLCRPEGGSALRTVMAIAERMPDVGRRFYERVIAYTNERLATYLREKVKTGELAIDDCDLAAAQFMQSCQATLFQPYIFQAEPAPSATRVITVVESAARMFLAAYRPASR